MEYCTRCKKSTPHRRVAGGHGENAGNYESACTECGERLFHIQGFNANLM